MPEMLVLIADRARARIFEVDKPQDTPVKRGQRLIEVEDLIEPKGQQAGKDQFSNLKSGRSGSPRGVPEHSFDDHRDSHLAEVSKRFARRCTEALGRHFEEKKRGQIVLFAAPSLLGVLRQELERASLRASCVAEVAEDLSRHSNQDIEEALVRKGLISARAEHTPLRGHN